VVKERILVVEDEAIVLLDLKNRLNTLGYTIVGSTAYGEEAIKKAEETRPDIVLMDIGLKGKIDGVQAAEKIRSLFNIPIIFLTANSDFTTLQRAKVTEPFGYILKPFDERELRTTIEMALYKHQLDGKLNETRRWLETTLNSISDAVVTTDVQSRITFMNPAAEAMTGWKAQEAMGRDVREIICVIDEETRQMDACPVDSVIRQNEGKAYNGHTALIERGGLERPVDISISPIRDVKGGSIGAVFVFRDVSEKRKAEKALRTSEANLAKAQAIGHMGNWEWDLRTGTMQWSSEVWHILGMDSENGKSAPDLFLSSIHPDDRPLVVKQFEDIPLDRKYSSFDFRISQRDGSVRYVHDEAEYTRDEAGTVVKVFGTLQDVTERKLAEEALKVSEERFFNVTNSTLDAIISVNDAGSIVFWNKAAERIFGHSKYEAIGKQASMIMLPEYCALFNKALETYNATGKPSTKEAVMEYVGLKKGGKTFPMEISISGWKEKGRSYFTAIIRDITERKQAEEAMRKSEDRFYKAFNFIPGSALITTVEEGRIVEVNDTLLRVTGYTRNEIVGRTTIEVGFLSQANRNELLRRLREAGRVDGMELQFRKKSGETAPGLLSCDLITMEDRQYIISMVTDISSLKRSIKDKAEAEAWFHQSASDLKDALMIIENNEVKYANRKAREIFGHEGADLHHDVHVDLAAPEEKDRVRKILDSHDSIGRGPEPVEYWIVRKDGSKRRIRNHHLVVQKDDKTTRKYVITRDITDDPRA
jgi:PAS domain S-box-containing protein